MFSESSQDPFALRRAASAVLDDRGRVVGWSERAERLLGHPGREVIGRPAQEFLVDPRDRPLVCDAAAECASAQGWFGVLPVRHCGGHRLELALRARPVMRADSVQEWFLVGAPAAEVTQWELGRAVLDGMFRRSLIGLRPGPEHPAGQPGDRTGESDSGRSASRPSQR
ncbi:PAS domain-containing protein [Streptomyces sp. ISL-99]|nr:PAS domain-containing protein [Streptomyces sp. ISL-99]